jgi:hypothetical protein
MGGYQCPEGLFCGSPLSYGISLEQDGVYNDKKIQYGINAFDNFGKAVIVLMQTINAEGWTDIMYNLADGYTPVFVYIYFCSIVIIGHYYILQLLLAVIMSNLSKIMS